MAHLKELFSKPLYGPNVMGDVLLSSKDAAEKPVPVNSPEQEGDARDIAGAADANSGMTGAQRPESH
jgi:hypothetical protein